MKRDAFSGFHPAVNFIFFLGALGFGMVIQHPAYLVAGIVGAGCYYFLLTGSRGAKMVFFSLPLCLMITLVNPLFNHRGRIVLFQLFGNPYTLEALVYGGVTAGIFLVMILWFGCYSAVMTGDKFTSLFGKLIPSISLLLMMIFRMVPTLLRKASQIAGARKSVGKGLDGESLYMDKVKEGMSVLGTLTSWALEGSIVTADSMLARGYGTGKRSSFMIYRMTARDWAVLGIILVLSTVILVSVANGAAKAEFLPEWSVAPIRGISFTLYCVYLLIPTALHIEEDVKWHIMRSKI